MIKKRLFACFCLLISTVLHAQNTNWIKGHAVWNYNVSSIVDPGSLRIETVGDTTIQGHVCRKLKMDRHKIMIINQFGDQAHYVETYYRYVYFDQDKVWYLNNANQFAVLYDFTMSQNQVRFIGTGTGNQWCTDSSYVIADSVYAGNLNGVNMTFYQLRDSSTNSLQHGGLVNSHFGMMEIGPDYHHHLFPAGAFCDTIPFEGELYQLRCFQDDSLTYNPGNVDCEYYTYLGLAEVQQVRVSVFPNPSEGKVELVSEVPMKNIRLTNVLGAVLKEIPTNLTSFTIDLSEFPAGTYYLHIEDANGSQIMKPVQISGAH